MLWGAAWLRRATQKDTYLNYIESNGKTLGADENINEFGWDNKHAGLNVLVSKVSRILKHIYILQLFTKMHETTDVFFSEVITYLSSQWSF